MTLTNLEVPSHWTIDRLKWSTINIVNGVWGDEPNGEDDIQCVRVADFNRLKLRVCSPLPTIRAIRDRERLNRVLQKGDLLIEKSGGGDNQPVGCVVSYAGDDEAVCSNFIGRMSPAPGMYSRYWAYAHAWIYSTRQNIPAIKQTTGIQNLDIEAYLDIRVPYPSFEEQVAISGFLDRVTARIDALVDAKQRLLDLLAEKRKAVIATAVTRGLDPKVKLRDSGVPWLEEVPEHWNVVPFRWYFKVGSGAFVATEDVTAKADAFRRIPVYGANGVTGYTMSSNTIEPHSIVVGRVGACGNVHVVNGPAWVTDNALLLRNICAYHVEYLAHVLRLCDLNAMANKTAQPLITGSMLTDLRGPLPPLSEQKEIVDHIARETAKLDRVRAATERTILLLKERRAALIAAAVTGQIDVGAA